MTIKGEDDAQHDGASVVNYIATLYTPNMFVVSSLHRTTSAPQASVLSDVPILACPYEWISFDIWSPHIGRTNQLDPCVNASQKI